MQAEFLAFKISSDMPEGLQIIPQMTGSPSCECVRVMLNWQLTRVAYGPELSNLLSHFPATSLLFIWSLLFL